tara:strand:- start:19 stop:573 length:555 start_codon:yes stop_codon:yes gene_type:complete
MIDQEVSNILKSRRSIYPRDFTGELISKETILEILENANHAPTHKITQPWIFKIFCKNSKPELLNEILKINSNFSDLKKLKLKDNFNKSSHIICICMKKNNDIVPEWEEVAATAMAVQNIWISCVNSNIGGYWSTPKYAEKIHSFLSLNKYEKCLGFFYLGKHKSIKNRIINRKNIKEKIQWFE